MGIRIFIILTFQDLEAGDAEKSWLALSTGLAQVKDEKERSSMWNFYLFVFGSHLVMLRSSYP